tara:strand:+ start:636 stop:932 length:297 start_codon:yes stop_codon:yes gene_type:complete
MGGIQGKLGDLSWLGEAYADQGWVEVEGEATTQLQSSPTILAWEKAKDLLRQSDWAVLSDVVMTVDQRQSWITYRAKLRDIRMQPGFPASITWPTKPE